MTFGTTVNGNFWQDSALTRALIGKDGPEMNFSGKEYSNTFPDPESEDPWYINKNRLEMPTSMTPVPLNIINLNPLLRLLAKNTKEMMS